MHLSLKGSLDRQPLVDRIGDKLLPTYPGSAAAYSLRALNGDANNVVRVRRASDNVERDFTAREVSSGDMVNWVNVGKDYVGYAAFQNSSTSEVNLSSSFTLEASESWSIKFGYIGGESVVGLFGRSDASNTGFWFAGSIALGLTDDSNSYQSLSFGSALALKIGRHYEVEFFNTPSEGVRVTVDGVTMSTTPKIYGDITLNKIGSSRGRNGERVIENVRIDLNGDGTLDYSYAGDGIQASNWVDRMGSGNDGTPSGLTAYNNEFTDGFVETWYDQSGEGNDAAQTVTASQPKLVDAGALVDGGMLFDGVDDFLETTQGYIVELSQNPASVFCVASADSTPGSSYMLTEGDGISPGYSSQFIFNYPTSGSTLWVNTEEFGSGFPVGTALGGFIYDGTNFQAYMNGSTDGSPGTADINAETSVNAFIGSRADGTTYFFAGKIEELITYKSDQSSKRTAIEDNINNHYEIY